MNLRLVTDEAEAVLQILTKRSQNRPITDADWSRVFSSEGYVRLKQRETAMKRSFEDAEFKTFVLSSQLSERAKVLQETLERWKRADILRTADRALAYLPKNARINAKIYPVIKPRENSFVFGVPDDPAIFLYLNPATSREKFENTLAHELHHIGFGSSCTPKQLSDDIAKLPAETQTVLKWIGAFGEGFAMLAAAGGPDIHPHAVSDAEERGRWNRDMANFSGDLKKVEKFFLDVLAKRLNETEIRDTAFSFFGIQGPWYTVGYKMAVLIEKTYGRDVLINAMCDQRLLLEKYNQAAFESNRRSHDQLPLWSATLLSAPQQPH
ncbi:MAG TPA: DUF5700 domain-containing putative Zn-dependent protease [Pyrinomonadaceae bacterium]